MSSPEVRIVFTASNSWFGKIIRWVTHSKVSHVFIEFPVWDRRMVGEATVGGTRMVLAEKSRHNIIAEYTCLFETKPGLLGIASLLGTKYDYAGTLVIAWWEMLKDWFHTKLREPRWSSKSLKCSELVFIFLEECRSLPSEQRYARELVTPQNLLESCAKETTLFRRVDDEVTKKMYVAPILGKE